MTTNLHLEEPSVLKQQGYRFRLDDEEVRDIGENDAVGLAGVTPGEHSVELLDVPTGCRVVGDNPRAVMVTGGGQAEVTFEVDCTLVPH